MGEAKALYGKGEFEQSRLKYVEACSIARTDNCVRSLAVAELAAGRPADAYVHFQEVAKGAAAVRLDPRAARELNELVQEAYAKCGHVEVVAPPGTLLAVDEKSPGAVPSEAIAVDPGPHTFEAQRGERHKRVTQDEPAGSVVRVVFKDEDLVPATVGVAPVGPVTTVTTTTPVAGVDAEAQTKTWPPVGAWILGGVGLAGIGVGIGFAVDAGSQRSTVSSAGISCAAVASAACGKILDAQSALKRDYVIDGVAFGAGGAALGAAILWTLLAPRSSTSSTALTPDISPGRAGLLLNSTF